MGYTRRQRDNANDGLAISKRWIGVAELSHGGYRKQ